MWKLIEAMPVETTLDASGVHVVIHRVVTKETHKEYSGERILVRADLMGDDNEPIVSYIGPAENVRKRLIGYIVDHGSGYDWRTGMGMSLEHASYIGAELYRASIDPAYCQD